jgi:hypothetical protein
MAWLLTTQMPIDVGGGELAMWLTLALAAGCGHCLIVGLVTGAIVAYVGAHPILVTLGTQTLIGISIWRPLFISVPRGVECRGWRGHAGWQRVGCGLVSVMRWVGFEDRRRVRRAPAGVAARAGGACW